MGRLREPGQEGTAAADRQRILPVYCSDNYLSLLPGETREIQIEAPPAALQNKVAALALDGFNIVPLRVEQR